MVASVTAAPRERVGSRLRRRSVLDADASQTAVPPRPGRRSDAHWGSLTEPTAGEVDTPAGPVDFRAETLTSEDRSRGAYVVAVFRELEQRDVNQATAAAGGIALAALVAGSLLAWTMISRALRPVAAVTRAAQSISETDLTRRIPVKGDDEIGRLAATFNDMDRLESAFATLRAFLDEAGHELRTPITVITGQLELLQDDPEQRRQTINLVIDELDRMPGQFDLLVLDLGLPESVPVSHATR